MARNVVSNCSVGVLFLLTLTIVCSAQEDWNDPQEPFRIFGNTYYVGTKGLSAILITSDAGHILIDGGLPQSAALILENVGRLHFRVQDIKLILNSHEHYDHAGGLAELQRQTGARIAASPAAARALQQGHPLPGDPQYRSSMLVRYPRVKHVEAIADRTTLRTGSLSITAHFKPGHTPGATTWTWRSCEGVRCLNIVYADGLTPVSDDGFRFTGDAKQPSIIGKFRRSITRVKNLPCDVILAPHPEFVGLSSKLEELKKGSAINPFIEDNACRTYASTAQTRLAQRILSESNNKN